MFGSFNINYVKNVIYIYYVFTWYRGVRANSPSTKNWWKGIHKGDTSKSGVILQKVSYVPSLFNEDVRLNEETWGSQNYLQ